MIDFEWPVGVCKSLIDPRPCCMSLVVTSSRTQWPCTRVSSGCWLRPVESGLHFHKIRQYLLVAPFRVSYSAPCIVVSSTPTCTSHDVDARGAPKDFPTEKQISPAIAVSHRLALPAHSAGSRIQNVGWNKRYSGHPGVISHATLEEQDRGIRVLAQPRSQDTSCSATCLMTRLRASDRL